MPSRLTSDLDRAACLGLLATRSFGRLVFTRRALPEVLPVAYRLDGENVVIRLAAGSAAVRASLDAIVAFEADDIETSSGGGWTVTVVGLAQEITHLDDRLRLVLRDLGSWAVEGKEQVVSISTERISGRWLTADPPARGSAPSV